MNLEFIRLTLGPLPNNVYLLGDVETGDAVVIDPSMTAVLSFPGLRSGGGR